MLLSSVSKCVPLYIFSFVCLYGTAQGMDVGYSSSTAEIRDTSSSSKVGLLWSNANTAFIKNFVTDKVSTIYNSSPSKIAGVDALGLEFVPMLSDTTQTASFQSLVVPGYATHVLGFNEPDQAGQANLSPAQAANLWRELIDPLKNSGYTLISPSISSGSTGIPWLQNFFNACQGCTVNKVAVHWFGTDPNAFIEYLEEVHDLFSLPIWVTEFACENFNGGAQCTQDQANALMDASTAFMDSNDWVERYFALGLQAGTTGPNSLIDSNGLPTDLGEDYIN